MSGPILLSYTGCETCKKTLRWLNQHGVAVTIRPIVDKPPTEAELARWIPRSGLPVRKWLNTSGQSYRTLGKEQVAAASDETLVRWLAADGKLVRRPVLVHGDQVLVGFREEQYEAVFSH